MELIPSADGSLNAFNTHFSEHYASNSYGALSEKLGKHIAPVWEVLASCKMDWALSDLHFGARNGNCGDWSAIITTQDNSLNPPCKTRESTHQKQCFFRAPRILKQESRAKSRDQTELESNNIDSSFSTKKTKTSNNSVQDSRSSKETTLCDKKALLYGRSQWHTLPVPNTHEAIHNPSPKAKTPKVWILDLCFGLGYNALLSRLFSTFDQMDFYIISIEQDKQNLALASKIHALDSGYVSKLESSRVAHIARNVSLQILWGDARILLADLQANLMQQYSHFHGFDVIYQDPFSYEKNSALWDLEHFCTLASLLKDSGIITTYATRKEIITNAQQAGLLAYRYKVDSRTLDKLYQQCARFYPNSLKARTHKRSSSIFSKAPVHISGSTLRS